MWLLRVRAVLAGALVLGLGATMTLASWHDQEEATGVFAAGTFDVESATTGDPPGAWVSHPNAPGAVLAFAATAMEPGRSFYAWINVRTTATTTVGGTIGLAAISTTGALPAQIEYRAVNEPTASSACDSSAFAGTPSFIAGNSTTYLGTSTVPGTPVTSVLSASGGNTLRYCFEIRIMASSPSSAQGATGTITWRLVATSS